MGKREHRAGRRRLRTDEKPPTLDGLEVTEQPGNKAWEWEGHR